MTSDDKKPAWNRAKVSIGATSRFLSSLSIHTAKYKKIQQISLKIYGNCRNLNKSIESNESL